MAANKTKWAYSIDTTETYKNVSEYYKTRSFKLQGRVASDDSIGVYKQYDWWVNSLINDLEWVAYVDGMSKVKLPFDAGQLKLTAYGFLKAYGSSRLKWQAEEPFTVMTKLSFVKLICEMCELNLKTNTDIAVYLNDKVKER